MALVMQASADTTADDHITHNEPAWDGVDFSQSFRVRVLNGIIPLVFACVSLAILVLAFTTRKVIKAIKRRRRRKRLHKVHGGSSNHGHLSHRHGHTPGNRGIHAPHLRTHTASPSDDAASSDGERSVSPAPVPLPQVIIETEAEHDANDSHDLMLEAENAVIRAHVKSQGIVWPGAFKALGMMKEKEDHHQKLGRVPIKYLAVPGDGEIHDSDSWIQWWKDPRKTIKRKARGTAFEPLFITKRRKKYRKWTWKKLGQKLLSEGKKDFVQALLAWSVVAVVLTRAALMDAVSSRWKWCAGAVWTYFTLLMEVRQYTALLHRSPFRTRKYDRLTYHIVPFTLAMSLLSLLDLRSSILQYHHHSDRSSAQFLGLQVAATAITLVVFLMEVLTPRPSNFLRKSAMLELRAGTAPDLRQANGNSGNGNSNGWSSNSRRASYQDNGDGAEHAPLLPSSADSTRTDATDDDEEDEDEDMLDAIDILLDDESAQEEKDKEIKEQAPPSPEVGASIFSLSTYTYIGYFLFRHARQAATFNDVPDLRADDKSAAVVLEFRAACRTYPRWLQRRSQTSGMRQRPSIFLQICWYFLPELRQMFLWAFIKPWVTVLPPLFIQLLLKWTAARERGEDVQAHVALLYVAGMFCAQMASSLSMSAALIIGRRLCIRAKALVTAEVFTKTLRRKDLAGKALVGGEKKPEDADPKSADKDGEGPASAGRIQNLVSVDAFRIAEVFAYTHFFIPDAPLTLIIAITMLFRTIGYSAFAAVGAMLLLSPYQSLVAKFFMRYQNEVLKAADDRLSLTTEVFQAIKVLKFFAWERKFADKVAEKRVVELRAVKKRVVAFAAGGIALFGASTLIALVTFVFHTKVFHQQLDAATAFTALALFNVIRTPLEQLADMASQLFAAIVSCGRVDELLAEEETAKYAVVAQPTTASDPKIGFVNASYTWADADAAVNDTHIFTLKNLNLAFAIDGLNLVVGPVGSGKSSLLYALLGEMNVLNGKCFLPSPIVRETDKDPATELTDTVAFCPQTPWLLNDTIRNNILFGSAYNAKRYKRVLHACALFADLEVFDLGDKTQVGEKGTVLSGGQKARISLARAIYSSARVILLDDVLSAVDAHTARQLYDNCLTSEKLMRGRTRILVTHALHLTLPCADYMVALANGHVVFDGPAVDYVQASGANTPGLATGQDFSSLSLKSLHKGLAKVPIPIEQVEDAAADQAYEQALPHLDEDPLGHEGLLQQAEKQSKGAVGLGVYSFYIKANGTPIVLLSLVAVIAVTEVFAVSTNWMLRLWASSFDTLRTQAQHAITSSISVAAEKVSHEPDWYLKRYAVLAILSLFFFGARMLFFLWRGTIASKNLYDGIMKSLLLTPIRFYDQTPLGRIMNRLSSDMETIDQDVPAGNLFFVLEIAGTTAVIVAIAIALPLFLIAGVFISMAYVFLGWLYITSSRELKRIEAVTRSPVFSLVGESLMGVTSIRAYSDASRFTSKLFGLLDDTNRPFFCLWMVNRWLSIRSDLGGALFAFVTACFIVASPAVSASLAGFALTYALIMEERILWIVRLYAKTQVNMNAVERVKEYSHELPQEPQSGNVPPAYWPSSGGSIEVENLEMRYAENLPPALKGISFDIKPSERVAIVGRTGSGKSTLALSFFRFVEASKGRIVIDGTDISTLKLHTLRDRLTVIPQDAALFSGTVRFNLDPFETHTDAELYDILRRVRLLASQNASGGSRNTENRSTAPSDNGSSNANAGLEAMTGIVSLDDPILSGGKNLSAGQRQLLCLARGLLKLRNSNVLVLDESTANLDHETDVAVQKAIREEIGGRSVTVLCIAHRLHTIIDFDRVLVLSNGKVLEYDTPSNLLSTKDSEFARLCRESGDFERLKETADRAKSGRK